MSRHRHREWRLATGCGWLIAAFPVLLTLTVLAAARAYPQNWVIVYILTAALAVLLTLTAAGFLMWLLFKLGAVVRRALLRRRDARLDRHIAIALGHLKDPIGSAETQVLVRYERELADLSQYYVFPGDFR